MNSETPFLLQGDRDECIVRGFSGTRANEDQGSSSSTQTAERTLRTVRLIAPLVVAAAFAAPQVQTGVRRLFSGGQRSRSEIIDFYWALDDWAYTEERGTRDQIQALNALLALPAREGFSLELPD